MRIASLMALIGLVITWFLPADAVPVKITGSVTLEDGTPCSKIMVSLRVVSDNSRRWNTYCETDEHGAFGMVFQSLKSCTLECYGQTDSRTIIEGQNPAPVPFVIPRAGLLLTAKYPNGATPDDINASASYKSPTGGAITYLGGIKLAPGQYLIPQIPANATEITAIFRSSERLVDDEVSQSWTYTTAAKLREETVTLRRGVPLKVKLVDAAGHPITGTYRLFGMMKINGHWQSKITVDEVILGAEGLADLGLVRPGQFSLRLYLGRLTGNDVAFTVQENDGVTTVTYPMTDGPHDITHTVVDRRGTPISDTRVHASYTWMDNVVFLDARTDALGNVLWKDIPSTPLVLWGDGVPVGMIPADAREFTSPLDSLPTDDARKNASSLCFRLTNPETKPVSVFWSHRDSSAAAHWQKFSYDQHTPAGEQQTLEYFARVNAGTPFGMLLLMTSSPPRCAEFTTHYAPLANSPNMCYEIPLTWRELPEVHGQFVDAAGKPVAGVSRLAVVPVHADPLPELLTENVMQGMGFYTVQQGPGGTFTFTVPSPGRYRLLVDLYDHATPTPPSLLIDAKPGINTVKVVLPRPLCILPAGTEINWVTAHAPGKVQHFTVAAFGKTTPIYGGTAGLLAYWYSPTANTMKGWNARTGAFSTILRTVHLQTDTPQRSQDAMRYTPVKEIPFVLMPSFPFPLLSQDARDAARLRPQGFAEGIFLQDHQTKTLTLWPGQYPLFAQYSNDVTLSPVAWVTIPETGTEHVSVAIAEGGVWPVAEERYVEINFPKTGQSSLSKATIYADDFLAALVDAPAEGKRWLHIPSFATSFTVQWLGAGVLENLPVPPQAQNAENRRENNTIINPPSWQPGIRVSGTVLNVNGTPFANQSLTISQGPTSVAVTTDATGKFSLQGVLPGPFMITCSVNGESSGWTVMAGSWNATTSLTLRRAVSPIRLYLHRGWTEFLKPFTSYSRTIIWWLPDGGLPQTLALSSDGVPSYVNDQIIPGPGRLWATDGVRGKGYLCHKTLSVGNTEISLSNSGGPSLGLFFPLDPVHGIPGQLQLIGTGSRAGLVVDYIRPEWRICPLLNTVTTQLDTVPPGTYTVRVLTTSGVAMGEVTVDDTGGALSLQWP